MRNKQEALVWICVLICLLMILLLSLGCLEYRLHGEKGEDNEAGDNVADGTHIEDVGDNLPEEEDVEPTDADADGFAEEDDCDDEDPDVHPDAEEILR